MSRNAACWPVISLIVFAVMKALDQQHPRCCIRITVRPSRRLLEELRSYKLAAKMREIGISLSFSRPRVSNDNAYAESLFRTMKYHESYPLRRFRSLDAVRCWVAGFVEWYNGEHRHSGIKYVTPNQRHFGEANEICAVRQQTYDKAYQENPRRWSRLPRCWKQPEVVKINHPRPEK